MEISNFVKTVVGIVVALLIIVSVAVPIIDSQTDNIRSIETNDNIQTRMSVMDPETDVISIAKNTDNTLDITINGTTWTNTALEYEYGDILTDKYGIHLDKVTANCYLYDITNNTHHLNVYNNTNGVEISGGVLKYDYIPVGTGYTATYTEGLMYDPDGDLAVINNGGRISTESDTIAAVGAIYASSYLYVLSSGPTTDQTIKWSYWYDTDSKTYSDVKSTTTITLTVSDPQDYSVQLDSATATYGDRTFNMMVIVPMNYYVVTDTDNATRSIVSIIPLLMVVSIIVAVIASFLYTRYAD